jgi:hypothetical protein
MTYVTTVPVHRNGDIDNDLSERSEAPDTTRGRHSTGTLSGFVESKAPKATRKRITSLFPTPAPAKGPTCIPDNSQWPEKWEGYASFAANGKHRFTDPSRKVWELSSLSHFKTPVFWRCDVGVCCRR